MQPSTSSNCEHGTNCHSEGHKHGDNKHDDNKHDCKHECGKHGDKHSNEWGCNSPEEYPVSIVTAKVLHTSESDLPPPIKLLDLRKLKKDTDILVTINVIVSVKEQGDCSYVGSVATKSQLVHYKHSNNSVTLGRVLSSVAQEGDLESTPEIKIVHDKSCPILAAQLKQYLNCKHFVTWTFRAELLYY